MDLREAAAQAAQLQQVTVPDEALEGVLDFVARRLEQLLVDEGCGIEAVKAVLSERGYNPAVAAESARELQVQPASPLTVALDGSQSQMPCLCAMLADAQHFES